MAPRPNSRSVLCRAALLLVALYAAGWILLTCMRNT